ncbi:MAG: hypothetical protein N2450_02975 [bacterium]|nr:hypothetical protein [bacterium]
MNTKLILFLLFITLSIQTSIYSQSMGATGTLLGTGTERGAQYYIGSQNELLMAVNIWGLVLKPGQYLVPSTTDLITLVSVAGGPAPKARLDNVRIIRSSSAGSEVIIVNIKKYLSTGDERLIPKLEPGDTIIIAGSLGELASQIVAVLSQMAIVANVYYYFFIRK